MKDIDLSSMISMAKLVFEKIGNEYKDFLSPEKKEFLLNFDFSKIFKTYEDKNLPIIYLFGDTYYLNLDLNNQLSSLKEINNIDITYLQGKTMNDIFNELVVFMCLSLFCGELNPLKIGLMENSIREFSLKYGLKTSPVHNYKELEVAKVVLDGLLNDVPLNIIFLDNDSEVFHYLVEEKGSKVAIFYYKISELMKSKYKSLKKEANSLESAIQYYNMIDYKDVLDLLYEFISEKVR